MAKKLFAFLKFKGFILFCSVAFAIFAGHAEEVAGGASALSMDHVKRYDRDLFTLSYRNTSDVAHCIRSIDFGPEIYSDSLKITDERGRQAQFKGPILKLSERAQTQEFLIVPPGASVSESLAVSEAYRLNRIAKGKITVRYGLAIIPCSAFENAYVAIPSPSGILLSDHFDSSETMLLREELAEAYPAWAKHGFVETAGVIYEK